jgi:hypothetical protein
LQADERTPNAIAAAGSLDSVQLLPLVLPLAGDGGGAEGEEVETCLIVRYWDFREKEFDSRLQ